MPIHRTAESVDDAAQELLANHCSGGLGETDDAVAATDAIGRSEHQRGAALGPDCDDLSDAVVARTADANRVAESKAESSDVDLVAADSGDRSADGDQ
jgi:hypothetical protein